MGSCVYSIKWVHPGCRTYCCCSRVRSAHFSCCCSRVRLSSHDAEDRAGCWKYMCCPNIFFRNGNFGLSVSIDACSVLLLLKLYFILFIKNLKDPCVVGEVECKFCRTLLVKKEWNHLICWSITNSLSDRDEKRKRTPHTHACFPRLAGLRHELGRGTENDL